MGRRRSVQIAAVAAVLIFASLGTAGARQIWNESQAHSAWQAARAAVAAELKQARALGLRSGELASLRQVRSRLAQSTAPSGSAPWSSARADFYAAQTRAYRSLAAGIARRINLVTQTTHQHAGRVLARLRADIAGAIGLDVDSSGASRTLASEAAAFKQAPSPRANRAITATASAVARSLERAMSLKRQRVNAVLQQDGGSLNAVVTSADAAVQAAQGPLGLLGLFTSRAGAESRALQRLDSAVHRQTTAQGAAVAEISLADAVAALHTEAARTVPNKLILVSTEDQMATMYENGRQVYSTPVTTGGPELPTDHGIFHIYLKESPFVFHSPWPEGSPYYYPPTPVTFWMPFDGAEGLHDASWRTDFGPGSNYAPTDLGTGNYILGTHGCVNLPYDAAQFVWDWAPVGTTVVVI